MNADQERLLRIWLENRDPGDAPDSLRVSAAQVVYATQPARFPGLHDALARMFGPTVLARPVMLLVVVLALLLAAIGAALVMRPHPFLPPGLIAFTAPLGATGGTGIRLVAADGTGERAVTPAGSSTIDRSPRWSADGKTLLFARNVSLGGANYCEGEGSVVLYDIATAKETVVATGVHQIGEVAWSPSGDGVAFTTPAPGCFEDGVLGVVDVRSGRMTTRSLAIGLWHLSWSGEEPAVVEDSQTAATLVLAPDGKLVARCHPDGIFAIGPVEVVDRGSGATISLGEGAAPSWSPDGRSLAFARVVDPLTRNGLGQRVELALAGVEGWHIRSLGQVIEIDGLIDRSFRELDLRWTRDGKAIYWADARGGHAIDVATGQQADLPAGVRGSSDPQWQPITD
jgi:Tol biopolymer transport system component